MADQDFGNPSAKSTTTISEAVVEGVFKRNRGRRGEGRRDTRIVGRIAACARLCPQTWREPLKHWTALAAAGVIAAATLVPAKAADISGAGATFPYPIYAKWADAYKKVTGNGLNYQSIGSGGGIKQIKAKTVTFGASDAPLPGKEVDEGGLAQFPMVMGGIVPVVNLDGVNPGDLTLDGLTLAKIFLGDIKTWDDPAIKKLNPNAKLPNQAIAIVHRSDGS